MSSSISQSVRSVGRVARSASRRFVERLRVVEQAGQDVLEYAGMLIVVAFVIVGLFAIHIPQAAAGGVASAYNAVFQSGHTYKAPQAVTVPSNINDPSGN